MSLLVSYTLPHINYTCNYLCVLQATYKPLGQWIYSQMLDIVIQ